MFNSLIIVGLDISIGVGIPMFAPSMPLSFSHLFWSLVFLSTIKSSQPNQGCGYMKANYCTSTSWRKGERSHPHPKVKQNVIDRWSINQLTHVQKCMTWCLDIWLHQACPDRYGCVLDTAAHMSRHQAYLLIQTYLYSFSWMSRHVWLIKYV